MKKVYLYVHDEKGFGHLSRMLKIYHTLNPYFDVCILLSGTLKITDPKVKYIQLPYASEFELVIENISRIENNLKERRIFLKKILLHTESFDLFLDYYPFGRHALFQEIDMMIDMAKENNGKVFSVMRDMFLGKAISDASGYKKCISDMRDYFFPMDFDTILSYDKQRLFKYLGVKGLSNMAGDILLHDYLKKGKIDNVLVFGDEKVYSFKDECPLSSTYSDCFVSGGYLLRKTKSLQRKQQKNQYVLVSVGGNIFDIKKFFSLLMLLSQLPKIPCKIVIGSMVEEKLQQKIQEKFHFPHMEFTDFSEKIENLLEGANVFIGGGGYGACTDLMQYKIPAFLYLNYNKVVQINKTEQYNRICRLSHYMDIHYVDIFDTTIIKKIVQTYKKGGLKNNIDVDTKGRENLLKFLGIEEN